MTLLDVLGTIGVIGVPYLYVKTAMRFAARREISFDKNRNHPWKLPPGELVVLAGAIIGWFVIITLATVAHATPSPRYVIHETAWEAGWFERIELAGGLTVSLVAEHRAMTPDPDPAPVIVRATVRTAAPPAPPPAPPRSVEEWRPLVSAYFPAENVDAALRVLACESRGNPSADNPTSTAAGLFQFIRSTWDWVAAEIGAGSYDSGAVYDPETNVRAAAWLSKGGTSWTHWVCRP